MLFVSFLVPAPFSFPILAATPLAICQLLSSLVLLVTCTATSFSSTAPLPSVTTVHSIYGLVDRSIFTSILPLELQSSLWTLDLFHDPPSFPFRTPHPARSSPTFNKNIPKDKKTRSLPNMQIRSGIDLFYLPSALILSPTGTSFPDDCLLHFRRSTDQPSLQRCSFVNLFSQQSARCLCPAIDSPSAYF